MADVKKKLKCKIITKTFYIALDYLPNINQDLIECGIKKAMGITVLNAVVMPRKSR